MHTATVQLLRHLRAMASRLWGSSSLTESFPPEEKRRAEEVWAEAVREREGGAGLVWGPLDRVQLGLILRQATQDHFSQAVTLACACLAVESLSSHFASLGSSGSPGEQVTDLLVGRLEQRGEGGGDALCDAVQARLDFLRELMERGVRELGLQDELQRPTLPLTGHDIKRVRAG